MQIKEIMSCEVKLVDPETTLRQAACMMRDCDTGFLPVGENDRLVGTVTDRDIAIRAVAEGKDPDKTKVRDAMSKQLAYCFEDQDAQEAAEIMSEKQIRRLPVLNRDKRMVGVVSLGDLAERGQDRTTAGQALGEVSRHPGGGATTH